MKRIGSGQSPKCPFRAPATTRRSERERARDVAPGAPLDGARPNVCPGQASPEPAELVAHLYTPEGRKNPFPTLQRLRTSAPVCPASDGLCHVFSYGAVSEVLRSPERFGASEDIVRYNAWQPRWRERREHLAFTALRGALFMTDPPIHTRLRKVIARAFSARRFMNIRAALASTANEYLERLADEGAAGKSVDFVQIVAKPFSAAVHAEYLLGIPREHYAALLPLMDAWFSGVEPNANASDVLQADEAVRILTETCRVLLGEHRHRRDETLISILASDPQLEDDERIPNLFILLSAYITTCHAIGNGVVTLLKTPRAARELRARPELAPTAVEELIRICPSIRLRSRAARVDTDLHGVKVPAGTAVLLWLEAANRDPTVFTNPNRLNLARRPNPHLSFGGANIHACLGGMLARLELETLLPTLLRRFEGLHLSAEPVGIPGTQVSGYSSIPLSLGLSRRVSR